jgi:Zn-dependent protease
MGALAGLPVLGYAKPVPVNPNRLRKPRRDMVYVSLAGPITNFLLMAIAAVIARAMVQGGALVSNAFDDTSPDLLLEIVFFFAIVNLLLGVFNLLPIPPLDGSALVERLLPEAWLPAWYKYRPYGFLILLVLVFATGIVSDIIAPFYDLLHDFVVGR